jgi:hypothetical protein
MNQVETKGHAEFSAFNHPLRQARAWGMPELYDWQKEIITEAAKPGAKVAASFNNSAGKTRILVPLLGLSVMAAFPGATVVSTAGAEEQIEGQLFKYLEGMLRPYESAGWSIAISGLTVKGPKVGGLQSRWIARVPKDALTLEGYHGEWAPDDKGVLHWCPVCVIIDEAKSVKEAVFEALFRIEPDWGMVVSTPGEDFGPFYDAVDPDTLDGGVGRNPTGLWHYRRKIGRHDCPHLQTPAKILYLKNLTEKYKPGSSFIKSFAEGNFQRQTDENEVFTDTDLERVKAAMKPRPSYNPGRKFAGLEFSGGGDEQPIMILDGDKIVYEKPWREEDTDKLAKDFLIDLQRFGVQPRDAIADNGGIGQAIIDNMEARGYRGIVRYMNNQDPISRHEYADRITEDHWRFKEMLRLHPEIQLPDDPVLLKQMRQRRFVMDDHNRVKLEPKKLHRKRTGESPDRLDTLIMTFSEWKPPKPEKKPNEYHSMIEEEARIKRGQGSTAAFGWVKPQKSTAEMMRKINRKIM